MQFHFILVLFFLIISCSGRKEIKYDSKNQTNIDWSEHVFLEPFIDSLKMIESNNIIPKFLSNDCFDYDYKFYWNPKHNPISFRKKIIFSIENTETLKFIIKHKDEISSEICKEKIEHPYGGEPTKMNNQDLTNLHLLNLRLAELE